MEREKKFIFHALIIYSSRYEPVGEMIWVAVFIGSTAIFRDGFYRKYRSKYGDMSLPLLFVSYFGKILL